ncbi:MAG: peptide chain release factor N(5)-glutamine methyltransferase [Parvularculaceae bacterium]
MPDPSAGLTVGAALRSAATALASSPTAMPTAMLDARVLAKAAFALDDTGLVLQEHRALADNERAAYEGMIARRIAGEPVAHITGIREFWSLPIMVEPGILVPRADSETLIAATLARRTASGAHRVLDLGCGSGALLCALLSAMPAATGLGIDIDDRAVALTARNLAAFGFAGRARAQTGDWAHSLAGNFDVIVSNPPYIAETERGRLPREVERYENAGALFAGPDGADALRALAAGLPGVAAPEALIALEFGTGQENTVRSLFSKAFPAALLHIAADLAGRPRALIIDLCEPAR